MQKMILFCKRVCLLLSIICLPTFLSGDRIDDWNNAVIADAEAKVFQRVKNLGIPLSYRNRNDLINEALQHSSLLVVLADRLKDPEMLENNRKTVHYLKRIRRLSRFRTKSYYKNFYKRAFVERAILRQYADELQKVLIEGVFNKKEGAKKKRDTRKRHAQQKKEQAIARFFEAHVGIGGEPRDILLESARRVSADQERVIENYQDARGTFTEQMLANLQNETSRWDDRNAPEFWACGEMHRVKFYHRRKALGIRLTKNVFAYQLPVRRQRGSRCGAYSSVNAGVMQRAGNAELVLSLLNGARAHAWASRLYSNLVPYRTMVNLSTPGTNLNVNDSLTSHAEVAAFTASLGESVYVSPTPLRDRRFVGNTRRFLFQLDQGRSRTMIVLDGNHWFTLYIEKLPNGKIVLWMLDSIYSPRWTQSKWSGLGLRKTPLLRIAQSLSV